MDGMEGLGTGVEDRGVRGPSGWTRTSSRVYSLDKVVRLSITAGVQETGWAHVAFEDIKEGYVVVVKAPHEGAAHGAVFG